jgi:hypothetical protein
VVRNGQPVDDIQDRGVPIGFGQGGGIDLIGLGDGTQRVAGRNGDVFRAEIEYVAGGE